MSTLSADRIGKGLLPAALAVWLLIVSAGVTALWSYTYRSGPAKESSQWPAASGLTRAAGRPALVLFLHPHCPCSRATIGELALLMRHARGRAAVQAVFYRPAASDPAWARTDLWRSAEAIPGVIVRDDEGGREARAFGALVSGQAILYGPDGRLLFAGGITSGRGHSGDNEGRRAALALLTGTTPAIRRTPVFGCFLHGAGETAR